MSNQFAKSSNAQLIAQAVEDTKDCITEPGGGAFGLAIFLKIVHFIVPER